jgi:arylsulfatase A-like enzyme
MSLIRPLVCVVLLTAAALAAAPPNIILITVDTTRADRMGFLGSTLGLTPNLDKLASDSVVFTRAYAQAPLTAPSHATILTGTYPQFHLVNDFGVKLGEHLPYAPAILQAHGYRTAAFVGAMALDPELLAPGFDRGFDTYDAGFVHSTPGADRYHSIERRAGDVVEHALAWLTEHPKGPFFLWVHVYDAHDPYDPPEPYKSKYASAPYDGEIAYEDSALGKFLSELRTRGLYDGAVIALMADHGEALGDHGEDTHGFFLYDETIHVPLVIKLPGKASAGKRIETRAGLVDVLPTILQAVGIDIPSEVQGESLLSMMKAASPKNAADAPISPDRQAYAETDYGHDAYGWSPLRALRTGKYLYIKAPRQELYDQSADPKAEHDLSSASTAVANTLAGQVDAFRRKTSSSREAPRQAFSLEAQQKLAALGYMAANTSGPPNPKEQGADPKDKIEIGNLLHRANMLWEAGQIAEAVPVLRQLIAKEPDMAILYAKLGRSLMMTRNYPQAVPVLRKLVELNPDSPESHFRLGTALIAVQDFAGATPEIEIAVAKAPRWTQARLTLANAYIHTSRLPDAITQYNKVLEVTPDDYAANLFLGRSLLLSGDAAAAVPQLEKAAALQPKAPQPHLALSDAYTKLGRDADAAQEQSEAKRLAGAGPQ